MRIKAFALFYLLTAANPFTAGEQVNLQDIAALEKLCADTKSGTPRIEAVVNLPPPCADTTGILIDITDTWPFAKHWFFRLADHCFLVLAKRSDRDKLIEALIPGQPCRIIGKVRKFVWRDIASGGKLQPRFAVEIQDLAPRVEPPRQAEDAQYQPSDAGLIMRQPRDISGGVVLPVIYEEVAAVARDESAALGLDEGAWAWLKHSTNNGLPRILLHRQTRPEAERIKTCGRGQPITIKGHLYTIAFAGKPTYALVADEAVIGGGQPLPPDLGKTLPKFTTAEYPCYPKPLEVLSVSINAKALRDKRYTILIPYRGHEQAPDSMLQPIPALRGKPCWRLRLADSDLDPNIIVLAPDADGGIRRILGQAEPGDTLILRCRIAALDETRNYIEVAAVALPPPLPPEQK